MISTDVSQDAVVVAMEVFRPRPGVLYDLDATAALAGVTRRVLLMYCRSGLVAPSFESAYGAMAFTSDAIITVRRVERVRAAYRLDLEWLAAMRDVFDELEWLPTEVRGGHRS